MEHPTGPSPLPADHFRRNAARVRALARDATTPAIKKHLEEVALDYERIADRLDENGAAEGDNLCPGQHGTGQHAAGQYAAGQSKT